MHKPLLLVALLSLSTVSRAQKISAIDFDEIKRTTENPASPYYYPTQLKRLQAADTTLRAADYKYLYYGQVFNPGYTPYRADEAAEKFTKVFKSGDFNRAVPLGEEELLKHPFDLQLTRNLMIAYKRTGDRISGHLYATRYHSLLHTILDSGDGLTPATAIVPVSVADQHAVLRYYNLTAGPATLAGTIEIFPVVPNPDYDNVDDEPPVFKGVKMYLDASQPLRVGKGGVAK